MKQLKELTNYYNEKNEIVENKSAMLEVWNVKLTIEYFWGKNHKQWKISLKKGDEIITKYFIEKTMKNLVNKINEWLITFEYKI